MRCRRATACRLYGHKLCGRRPRHPPRHRLPSRPLPRTSCSGGAGLARRTWQRRCARRTATKWLRCSASSARSAASASRRGATTTTRRQWRRCARKRRRRWRPSMPTASPAPTSPARACSASSWRRSLRQALSSFGCRPKAAIRGAGAAVICVRVSRAPPRSPRSGRLARDAAQLAAERSPAAFALASWLEAELSSFVAEKHPPPPLLLGSAAAPAAAEEAMVEEAEEARGAPAQVHAAARRGGGRGVGRGGGRVAAAARPTACVPSPAVQRSTKVAGGAGRATAPEGASRRAARASCPLRRAGTPSWRSSRRSACS